MKELSKTQSRKRSKKPLKHETTLQDPLGIRTPFMDLEDALQYTQRCFYFLRNGSLIDFLTMLDSIWLENTASETPVPEIPLSKTPIATSSLPVRIVNKLDEKGYVYWGDLNGVTLDELRVIPSFGDSSVQLIWKALKGLYLKRVNS